MFSKTRIISGLIMAVAVLLILLIDDKSLSFVVFGIIIYFAIDEAKKFFKDSANIWLVFIFYILGTYFEKPLFFATLLCLLVIGHLVYIKSRNLKPALAYLYPIVPIFALWQVYLEHGAFALFWLIFIVAMCDTCAYFIGKLFGSTPFSPTSPNKTREGVVGGISCATIFGCLIGLFVYDFFLSLIISFLVAVFAVIGDLLESYFKRHAKIKDSGNLIPGHGGILDRIDAVIIAAFVMVALL
ncbi:phosphatidate cytidylyltransferase [Campylobacter sp. MIT 99-7217]|uniref:phosphatidate cytidylyltransferase n=1 Tax=Campylobacter sp. MIT 99-7217 TaxID=535091 RepID=UPI00115A618A|nr:phosphatidate cytidylyltransferase [Campylobacter sp. MIT 99-7217]TQR33850.1 phosphatidate cytidylyltransferase [Campylobacter sp. MIT 99-7217]